MNPKSIACAFPEGFSPPPATRLQHLLSQFALDRSEPRFLRWSPQLATATGAGVKIALLDSGVNWQHPMFQQANLKARDFTGRGTLADSTGHGTQMAALLVGRDSEPIATGLTPEATLLFGKVLGAAASAKTEHFIAQGIDWAVRQEVDILVLPLGRSRPSAKITLAIQRAIAAGIQVLAAAGNVGADRILFPASLPGVIAVTGADQAGNILEGCAQGEAVDCIAPGQVTSPGAIAVDAWLVGSSPATVIAAGVAALKHSLKEAWEGSTCDVGRKTELCPGSC